MTSAKQIKANKQNSLKCVVKTQTGKEISKLNATKHGIFCKSIYQCFMPANEYENQLVEILLSNLPTFRRICFIEKEYIEIKLHPNIKL